MAHGGGHHRNDSDSPNRHGQHHHHHRRLESARDARPASYQHEHRHHTDTHNPGADDWADRNHANQVSNLADIRHHEWFGSPYTFNASPLSWFQRYNAFHAPSTGIYRQYRDVNYTSSGSLSQLDHDYYNHEPSSLQTCWGPCCAAIFCGVCCTSGCCSSRPDISSIEHISSAEGAALHPSSQAASTDVPHGSSGACSRGNTFCLVFLLMILLLVSLLHVSRGDQHWNLNAGESYRLKPAYLTDQVSVTCSSRDNNVHVYEIHGKCPPLTGATERLSDRQAVQLEENSYAFEYFYLNKGSSIDVDVTASMGSADVYLIRGKHFVRQLEKSTFQLGANQYLLNRFASSSNRTVSLQYQVDKPDTYILLFDNMNTLSTRLSVTYTLELTSYDLSQRSPTCSNESDKKCTLKVPFVSSLWKKHCIIVQTVPNTSGDPENVITIHVTQHRRYGWIVTLTLLPLLVYSLFPYCHTDPVRSYQELYDAVSSFPPVAFPHYFSDNTPSLQSSAHNSANFQARIPVDRNIMAVDPISSYPVDMTGAVGLPVDTDNSYSMQ